jgi:hypothetical protein
MSPHWVQNNFDICYICKKVSKCHVLFNDGKEKIMVCGVCELE